jgi:hypothetical protein
MAGVCSGHWLEADEAAHGADRIEQELVAALRDQVEGEKARREKLREAQRLRALAPDLDRAQRVLEKIVGRFHDEVAIAGAAWAAGRLVAGHELPEDATLARLIDEGVAVGLGARECDYTVKAQVRRARSSPRVLPRKSAWSSEWETRW